MKRVHTRTIRSPIVLGSLAILTLLGLRLYHLFTTPHLLFADEAQYWDWAQTLAFGYYSKPPMIAWLIAGSTSLCGNGEGCIRLFSPLLHASTAAIIGYIGALLYNRSVGLWAAISYMTLPAIGVASSLISTDAPLLFCWSMALLCWILALRKPTKFRFIQIGIWIGLGMLSKYTMVMLVVSMLCYHSFYERRKLLWPYLFLTFLVAIFIYIPNFWWNIQHGMVSYQHTIDISRLGRTHTLSCYKLLEFIGGQIAVVGPIFAIMIIASIYTCIRNLIICMREETSHINPDALLLSATLPLLLLITSLSPFAGVKANWSGPCYISGLLLGISWAHKRAIVSWILAAILLHIGINVTWMRYDTFMETLHIAPHARSGPWWQRDPYYRQRGWDLLGEEIAKYQYKFGELPLLVSERKLMAELRYYAPPRLGNILKWNPTGHIENHYDLTRDIKDAEISDVIALLEPEMAENVQHYFQTATLVGILYWQPTIDYKRPYEVWIMRGFKNYTKLEIGIAQ